MLLLLHAVQTHDNLTQRSCNHCYCMILWADIHGRGYNTGQYIGAHNRPSTDGCHPLVGSHPRFRKMSAPSAQLIAERNPEKHRAFVVSWSEFRSIDRCVSLNGKKIWLGPVRWLEETALSIPKFPGKKWYSCSGAVIILTVMFWPRSWNHAAAVHMQLYSLIAFPCLAAV